MSASLTRQLRAAVALKKRAAAAEREAVLAARMDGWSWQKIAAELGVSHQATMQKYAADARAAANEDPMVVQQAQVILQAEARGMTFIDTRDELELD